MSAVVNNGPVIPGRVGYQMITSVQIRNFRGFKSVGLPDCRRINVIVGENASGKTALLEAIFLARGSTPELGVRLRQFRGFEASLSGPARVIEDAIWRDMFHKFDQKARIEIALKGTGSENRSLSAAYAGADLLIQLDESAGSIPTTGGSPITFEWTTDGMPPYSVSPRLVGGALQFPPSPDAPLKSFYFAANHTYSSAETAARFSSLSKKRLEKPVVQLFTEQFPFITGLSVEILAGSAMVFADVDGLPERVPLNILSAGINKLASILFAIPAQARSILIVDEIESGFYYKILPSLWRSLLSAAEDNDVQVFTSTHSMECLMAAGEVAAEHPEKFSVIQASRANGECYLRQMEGLRFINALSNDIEIR